MDFSNTRPSPPGKEITIIGLTVVLIILTVLAAYLIAGGNAGGGGPKFDPCKSPTMPPLAAGLACTRGAGGGFAWLTSTTPTVSGVAAPPGRWPFNTYKASDDHCVTESACQGYCLGANECSFYTYDASSQNPSKQCPATDSVCSLFSGPLPATIGAVKTSGYVTAGIPTRQLRAQ